MPNQVSVSWHGSDIFIRIAESVAGISDGGAIRLLNATNSASYPGALTQIQFGNGTVWGAPELHAQVSRAFATDGDDVLDYNYDLQYLALGKGNDELDGYFSFVEFEYANGDGRDTIGEYVNVERVLLKGLDRSDVTFRQMGNDLVAFVIADPVRGIEAGRIRFVEIMDETLGPQFVFDSGQTLTFAQTIEATLDYLGTNGDDVIEGTSRADRLTGKHGDDVLSGGLGSDTYVWSHGDGHDRIYDRANDQLETDTLLLQGVARSAVSFERIGLGILVKISESAAGANDGGSVIITNQMVEGGSSYSGLERIEFGDGSLMSIGAVATEINAALATSGNDSLLGVEGDETFEGGLGDDVLSGVHGADTFIYNRGDGSDRIINPFDDIIRLIGVDPAQVVLQRSLQSNNDIYLVVAPSTTGALDGGRITLTNGLSTSNSKIVFDDGTIWTNAEFANRLQNNPVTNGDDRLTGTMGNDVLEGKGGNDLLLGQSGSDTYIFTKGDGIDQINDVDQTYTGSVDRLVINGYAANEILFSRRGTEGKDLIIRFNNSRDQITIIDWQIEEVELAGTGTILTLADIRQQIVERAFTDGDDRITGTSGSDTLSGGLGNDSVSWSEGPDTYIYRRGDGDDRLEMYGVLRLPDYNVSDIVYAMRLGPDSNDMVIRFTGERDRVILVGALNGGDIGLIEFANGQTWSVEDMRARVIDEMDGVNNDNVYGFEGDDQFTADVGNDTLYGKNGDDAFVFARGKGNDIVDDSSGANDKIVFLDFVSTETSISRLFRGSNTLVFRFTSSATDSVTVIDALVGNIESFVFSDGVTWTQASLLPLLENRAPVAVADGYFSAVSGQPTLILSTTLLSNDFDTDNDQLRIIAVDGGANGTAQLDANGNVVFLANAGFSGATQFTYTMSDGRNAFSQASVDVRVRPTAQAIDDSGFTVIEDDLLTITSDRLLSNDIDGDRMVIGQVINAINGAVSLSTTGDIVFTPRANFNGVAQFTYAANTPEGGRAEAVVSVTVTSLNDAPIAIVDNGFQTAEDISFQIFGPDLLVNDTDVDGDRLTLQAVHSNENLDVSLTADGFVIVTPKPYYFGATYFEYTVVDPSGLSGIGRVNVNVAAVNNAPEPEDDLILSDGGAPILEDFPILFSVADLLGNDIDRDNDNLTLVSVGHSTSGQIEFVAVNQTILFTPKPNFNGDANFTYVVTDGQGATSEATATIRYQALNDIPVARDDEYDDVGTGYSFLRGFEDQSLVIPIAELMKNDTDVEHLFLNFENFNDAVRGSVVRAGNALIFTPDPDFWGETTFSYLVSDPDGGVDDAKVTLFFENVADAPPVARNDHIVIYEDVPSPIPLALLLGNDYDIDNDTISFLDWRYPQAGEPQTNMPVNGTITRSENGDLFFTPVANAMFGSGIMYRVTDGNDAPLGGASNWAFIDIEFIPIDDDPTATNDEGFITPFEVPLVLRVSTLLSNDFDVDDFTDTGLPTDPSYDFFAVGSVSAGTAEVVETDGERFIIVRQPPGFIGELTIEYIIKDQSGLTDSGYITATVASDYSGILTGTPRIDWLEGNNTNESIFGLESNDAIYAYDGDDVIEGFGGNDKIFAGDGNDLIDGGAGADRINGGDGVDTVDYSKASFLVKVDLASGLGQGGIAQGDILTAVENVVGTQFEDRLSGNSLANILTGGNDDDILEGRGGSDSLLGGAGNDLLEGGANGDIIDGGEGSDTADYFLSIEAVQISLLNGTATGGDATGDQLVSIENLTGSDFDDSLIGDDFDNRLYGRRGDDILVGGLGSDILIGGHGADNLQGGEGQDIADYSLSADGVTVDLDNLSASGGDAAGDTFTSIEIIQGSNQADMLLGDSNSNRFRGAAGADLLDGRGGFDTADYSTSTGPIVINLATGAGTGGDLQGDTLVSIEHVIGSGFADHLIGSSGDDSFEAGFGDDLLEGGAGSDVYRFGFDSKSDTVSEQGLVSDTDRLIMGSNIVPKNVSLIRQGDNLLVELENDGGFLTDTVVITDHFVGREVGIEEIVFADGTVWDRQTIESLVRVGRFNAQDDIYRVGIEDVLTVIDPALLIVNDAEFAGTGLQLVHVGNAKFGTVSIDQHGKINFLGALNHNGDAFFDYTVRDQFGRESTATVEVNLSPRNDAPVAFSDGPLYMTEDMPLRLNLQQLLSNDVDIDGDTLEIVDFSPLLDQAGNVIGAASTSEAGSYGEVGILEGAPGLFFKPLEDHFGLAGFRYTVRDAGGITSTADVLIFIDPVNDAPRSSEDRRTVRLDKINELSVDSLISNDVDPEGDDFDIVAVHSPTNGALTWDSTARKIFFTAEVLGLGSFKYDVRDEFGATRTIDVELTVIPLNDPPNAQNDSGFEVLEDGAITINVADLLANDTDPNDDVLILTNVERFPLNGKVVLNDGGTITFTPRIDFNGRAGFKYLISDGRGGFDTAFVAINVVPDNDAPQLRDDVLTYNEDEGIVIIPGLAFGNDMDPEGDVPVFKDIDFVGVMLPSYATRTAFVDDLEFASDGAPTDVGATATLADGTELPTWLSFDAQTLKFSGVAPEGEQAAVNVSLTFTFVDEFDLELVSNQSFTFNADDPRLLEGLSFDSDVALLNAGAGTWSAELDNGRALPDWLNFDAETMQLSYSGEAPDENASLEYVRVVFTPDAVQLPDGVFATSDKSFALEFAIDPSAQLNPAINSMLANAAFYERQGQFGIDLGDAASITAQLQTTAALPTWLTFNSETLSFEGLPPTNFVGAIPVRIDIAGNGSTLPSFSIVRDVIVDSDFTRNTEPDPEISTVLFNNRIFVTAEEDFNGTLILQYTAKDIKGAVSEPAYIFVNVLPMPERPDVVEDIVAAIEDQTVTFDLAQLLSNDVDDDGNPIRAISIGQPTIGTFVVNLSSFAVDGAAFLGAPAGAIYAATLIGGAVLPSWLSIDTTTGLISGLVPLDVKSTLEIAMTATLGETIWNGTASNVVNGNAGVTVTYTPPTGVSGTVTFEYTITDDLQGTGSGISKIEIAPVNDPPTTVNDTVNGLEDTDLIIDFATLLANDFDVDGDAISLVSVSNSTHGQVRIENGQIIFAPDHNFAGAAGFDYVVTDGTDGSATGHVKVNVVSTNQRPVAATDLYTVQEDEVIFVTVADLLANDSDPDGDSFSFVSIDDEVENARIFTLPDGRMMIQPDLNHNGTITFKYKITDGRLQGVGELKIQYAPVNDAPFTYADGIYETNEDTPITINLADFLLNDVDVEGDSFQVVSVFDGDNGVVVMDGLTAVFTPRADYFGNAAFTYSVVDSGGAVSFGQVNLTVLPEFDLPIPAPDYGYSVNEDSSIIIDPAGLLANDIDLDGDGITFVRLQGGNGNLVELPSGLWRFTPTANFFGVTTLTYYITNPSGYAVASTVTIDVVPQPDAPIGVDDRVSMIEDTPLTLLVLPLLANDRELDLEAKLFKGILSTYGVTIVQDGEGRLFITPDANFEGVAAFIYELEDSTGLTGTAVVRLDVAAVNDAPTIGDLPVFAGIEDQAFTLTLDPALFTDVEGDIITVDVLSAGGTPLPSWLAYDRVSLTLWGTPPANFNGQIALEVKASDGLLATVKPVVLTIAAINDVPVIGDLPSAVSNEDATVSVTLDSSIFADVDGDVLTVSVLASNGSALPDWLSFDAAARTLSGMPPSNFNGIVDLQVAVTDGVVTTVKPWTLTIAAVNDAPVIGELPMAQGVEDAFFSITLDASLFNDVDGDGLSVVVQGVDATALPTWLNYDAATFTLSGQPPLHFNGEIALEVAAADGTATAVKPWNLNVVAVNDAPMIGTLPIVTTAEDQAFSVQLDAAVFSDVDGNPLEATVSGVNGAALPSWLSFDVATRTLSGTPPLNFNGLVELSVSASDGTVTTVKPWSVDVTPVNDAPTSGALPVLVTAEDTSFSKTLDAALFADADGDTLTVSVAAANSEPLPAWINFDATTLTLSGTPPLNFNGEIALEVLVSDGQVTTVKPLSLSVTAVNDAPVIGDLPAAVTNEDAAFSVVLDQALFSDVDGDALTVDVAAADGATLPSWLNFNATTLTLSGTPPLNFSGTVELQVAVSDGTITSVKPWNVSVTAVNDAPTLVDLPVLETVEDTSFNLTLDASLFADVDGDALTVSVTGPAGATLPTWIDFDAVTRSVSGTPPLNFNGTVELEVSVSDGVATTSKPWVLTVTAANDAPVIGTLITAQGQEDQALNVVLDADLFSDVDGDDLTVSVLGFGGSPLPSWLSFNAETRSLTGTPPLNFNGDVELQVRVSDGVSTRNKPWTLNISPVNDAPLAVTDNYDAARETHIVIPLTTLLGNDTDVDGDALSIVSVTGGVGYTASLDGLGNLVIDRDRALSGILPVTYVVTDGSATVSGLLNVAVQVANQAPIIAAFAALHGAEDSALDLALPASAFSDPDGDTLTYSVARAGGTALPPWLTFNAQTLRLTGTPPANFNGSVALQVVAFDGALSTTRTFDLVIDPVNDIPVLAAPLSDRFVTEDQAFNITLQNNLTSDPDGDVLSYNVKLADGSNLPTWMTFNAVTMALSGTPPSNFFGPTQLRMFISDGVATISDDFTFTVSNSNDAPVLTTPLVDKSFSTGAAFTVTLPANTFTDPDGDALQFAAQLSNGQALPTWLSFNGAALTGTAPTAGTWNIRILASDGAFQVADEFMLTIAGGNSVPVAVNDGIFLTRSGVPVEILASQLMLNDSDIDGDALSVVEVRAAQHGTVSLNNGIVTYQSATGYTGTDQFIYKVSDGVRTAEAIVVVGVQAPPQQTITGGNGTDLLFGGNGSDYINGGNGADILFGGNGADIVYGGAGSDILSGDNGNDVLYGQSGSDILFGGSGNDFLSGGTGNDLLSGGNGADTFLFRQGDGSDSILDYRANQGDRIQIDMNGINNFDDLLATAQQQNGGVLFAFANGDELFLSGTQLAALDRNSFTFY